MIPEDREIHRMYGENPYGFEPPYKPKHDQNPPKFPDIILVAPMRLPISLNE